jgi:hypothetical protein
MKSLFYTAALVLLASVQITNAQLTFQSMNESEVTDLLNDETVVNYNVARLGGSTTWEVNSGDNSSSLDDPLNVTWTKNGNHGFNFVYDSNSGNSIFSITETDNDVVITIDQPTAWANQLLLIIQANFTQHSASLSDIVVNTEVLPNMNVVSGSNPYAATLITFSGFGPGNFGDIDLDAILNLSTTQPFLGQLDDIQVEAILVQNNTIPEPSSFMLLFLGLTVLLSFRNKKSLIRNG